MFAIFFFLIFSTNNSITFCFLEFSFLSFDFVNDILLVIFWGVLLRLSLPKSFFCVFVPELNRNKGIAIKLGC